MKKAVLLMAAAGLCVCLLAAGCGKKQPDKLEQVKSAQELRVLVVENAEPYSFYSEKGQAYLGIEVSIAQEIAADLDVRLVTVPVAKADILNSLPEGDLAIGRIGNYDSLRSNYSVSNPYAQGSLYVATPRGVYFTTLGAFTGKSVGVSDQLSEPARITVNGAQNVTLQSFTDANSAAKSLLDKTITGYFCYEEQAQSLMKNPKIQVQAVLNTDPESYVIAADKNASLLIAQVNRTIARLLENGTIDSYREQFSKS